MTKRQAKQLRDRVGREDPKCSATLTPDGNVQLTDHRTGHTAILRSADDWERRKKDADLAAL